MPFAHHFKQAKFAFLHGLLSICAGTFAIFLKPKVFGAPKPLTSLPPHFLHAPTANNTIKLCSCIASDKVIKAVKDVQIWPRNTAPPPPKAHFETHKQLSSCCSKEARLFFFYQLEFFCCARIFYFCDFFSTQVLVTATIIKLFREKNLFSSKNWL